MLVNSVAPASPSSRPYPDCLTPPNGSRGSEAVLALMNRAPELDAASDLECAALSRGPHACSQPVRRGVGDLDRLVVRGERDDCGCRAEGLLGHDGHVEGDVDQHGRREPGRTPLQPFASGQDFRAPAATEASTCSCEVLGEVGAGQRADLRGLVAGIADDQVGDGSGEPADRTRLPATRAR